MRFLLPLATLFVGMMIFATGLMAFTNPEAFHTLLSDVVPERLGYLYLLFGGIVWADYITRYDRGF